MSLRDDFEEWAREFTSLDLDWMEDEKGYQFQETDFSFMAYQSATERALQIGLDVHAWASARNLNWSTVLTEYERRIKGDSNG